MPKFGFCKDLGKALPKFIDSSLQNYKGGGVVCSNYQMEISIKDGIRYSKQPDHILQEVCSYIHNRRCPYKCARIPSPLKINSQEEADKLMMQLACELANKKHRNKMDVVTKDTQSTCPASQYSNNHKHKLKSQESGSEIHRPISYM